MSLVELKRMVDRLPVRQRVLLAEYLREKDRDNDEARTIRIERIVSHRQKSRWVTREQVEELHEVMKRIGI